jgi:hypothetical protein
MSMNDIFSRMHSRIEELRLAVSGNSGDLDNQEALKRYQSDHYNDLASLAWFLGCDADVFQREAVPAADLVDDAYLRLNLEREFDWPARRPVYSTMNREQQGLAR